MGNSKSIVGRLEGLEFQIRGWLLVFIGALVAALLAEKSKLSGPVFGGAAGVVVVLFGWMELVVRLPKRKAINRAGAVEEMLREGQVYDGPLIKTTLSGHCDPTPKSGDAKSKSDWLLMWEELWINIVYVFYIAVLVIIVVFARSFP